MRFGICCSPDEARAALEAGFDYVELPAHLLLDREAEYAELQPETTNLFFPSSVRLFGPDRTPYLELAEELIGSAWRVGVRLMVLGSGAARRAPESMDRRDAEAAFARVAAELAEIGERQGVVIAPESLNRAETNVGTNLRELATELHDLGVGYTADAYHVLCEWSFEGNEGPPPIDFWRDQLPYLPAHVHLASRDRFAPTPGDPDLDGFTKRLLELGYDGRVSLECRRRPDTSFAEMLTAARACLERHEP